MRTVVIALALVVMAAAPAAAQGRGKRGQKGVPPGHRPPAGECRVWYDGVPPGHQPAPTSCAEAERVAARDGGARVIYGDGHRDDRDGRIWRQGGGGDDGWGVEGDARRRDGRRDGNDDEARRREGSRDRGNRPATGRAIPRDGRTGTSRDTGDERRH